MKYSSDEMIHFLKDLSGIKLIRSDSDIFYDLRMAGDDFHEMIEKYAATYDVDLSGYLWYFHADEEGQNFGGLFFLPPYDRVNRIPVTPDMLTKFANLGRWKIEYPEHTLPKKRYDILLNKIIALSFCIGLLYWIILKWIH